MGKVPQRGVANNRDDDDGSGIKIGNVCGVRVGVAAEVAAILCDHCVPASWTAILCCQGCQTVFFKRACAKVPPRLSDCFAKRARARVPPRLSDCFAKPARARVLPRLPDCF